MLSGLKIKNIALISECDISLESGLNILSGETGAGKSIVIDSINFVLGARADKSLIRFGETSATVTATFTAVNETVSDILEDLGFERDDMVIIKRQMTSAGKSDIRINGEPATLAMLKRLAAVLMDIVGQHDNQLLLKSTHHIGLVDSFGGQEIQELKSKCAALYSEYKSYRDEIASFEDEDSRNRRLDILEYQINEIDEVAPVEGEYEELLDKRRKINSTERILSAIATAKSCLDDERGAISSTHQAAHSLESIVDIDESIAECYSRLDNAKIELSDIAETLSDIARDFDFSAYEQERVEKRIEKLRSIMRKYGATIADINAFRQTAEAERDRLQSAEERLSQLNAQYERVQKDLYVTAVELSNTRRRYARELAGSVEAELQELGMTGTVFQVFFENIPEQGDCDRISADGFDKVEFLLSPNRGAPLMSLSKIASGGEMNRILLAMKVVVSRLDDIGTVIFDEIDTGISGNVAQIVAGQMYKVSLNRQVIAVTHLAQLCAMADHSFRIEKNMVDGTTKTYIQPLDREQKIAEVGRLLGSGHLADSAENHSRKMIEWCEEYKRGLADNN